MYRSKSVLADKKKKQLKSARQQSEHRKQIAKYQTNYENYPNTQRAQSSREKIDERVTKIRQGFATLEKKLNWDSFNPANSNYRPSTSNLTKKKVSKKLFTSETGKRSPSKSQHKRKKGSNLINDLSPQNRTPKHSKYHSCFFEKSLYDLMKVVVMQRDEIERLNIQIKTHTKKGYLPYSRQKVQTK